MNGPLVRRSWPRFATIAALAAAAASPAAAAGDPAPTPRVQAAERAAVSAAVRDLSANTRPVISRKLLRQLHEVPDPALRREVPGVAPDADAALQDSIVSPGRAPTAGGVEFDGLSNADNVANFGATSVPSDNNLDVGPSQIVETTNLLVRIFDKSGTPLTPPFRMSTLFEPLGGICSNNDDGDPVVLYDPLADRWLLSQFALEPSNRSHECIAISQSGDATGAYFLYDFLGGFVVDDYPHFGVWPDGYYMATNQFDLTLTQFLGAGVFAFERERMLVGDPGARSVFFAVANIDVSIVGMLPSDFDGRLAPPNGTPNTFASFNATEFGDASDALRLFDFQVDWASPASSSFTERSESPLAVAAFNPLTPDGRDDIVQPGGDCSNALDVLADRLMHRLQYRRLAGGPEILVVNHTVNANGVTTCSTTAATFQAAVRLYELKRTAGTANQYAVAQRNTFAPDGSSRFMGSAASDHQEDLAVGYSAASKTVPPSIRYTGRLAGDPVNTLQSEATLEAGVGSQTTTSSRWGDYSALGVDPTDDCTFWYVQQRYPATSSADWVTRIGNFKFPSCTAPASGTLDVTVTRCLNATPIEGAAVEVAGGFSRSTDAAGFARFSPFATGSYSVTASLSGLAPAGASPSVANGATTALPLCLTGPALPRSELATVVGEACVAANNAVDPGELVTVSVCVENVGGAHTVALVGRLLASGGVTLPSAPQSYGALVAGGPPVCRDFTFLASPALFCAGTIAVTLAFADGVANLGSSTSELVLGVQGPTFSQDFDSGVALPAGWVAANTTGPAPVWALSDGDSDSPPNSVWVYESSASSDKRLTTPNILPGSPGSAPLQLTFRTKYDLDLLSSGGVLEISIGGSAFTDFVAAGGTFLQHGYDGSILGTGNPLQGRSGWRNVSFAGGLSGFLKVVAQFPSAAAGQSVQLRFRMGTGSSVTSVFWRIDSISIDGRLCCGPSPAIFVAEFETGNTSEWSSAVP